MIPREPRPGTTSRIFLVGALLAAVAVVVALVTGVRQNSAGPSPAVRQAALGGPGGPAYRLREALARTATASVPSPTPTLAPAPPPEPTAQAAGQVAVPGRAPAPPPPPPPPAPAPGPPRSSPAALDAGLAAELLALVNAERSSRGIAPLSLHSALVSSSAAYALASLELDWHQHTAPDGRTIADRIRSAGYIANVYLGEVMGWGWGGWSPADIVRSWIQSPPHEQVIFNPVFSLAGAGCAVRYDADGRRIHCVIDLAGP
jgi:uncharacterized protein YkwD